MLCTVYVLRHCIKQKKGLTLNVKPLIYSLFAAEAGGFEPPVPLRVRQFSKLVVSATHPHFHVFCASSLELRCKDRGMFLNKQSFLHLFSKKKMLLLLPILILRILFDKK